MDTVLITGSSRGLGEALALSFAEANYNIIIHGRDVKRLNQVQEKIKEYGVDCSIVSGDLSDAFTRTVLITEAISQKINILINNAGNYLLKSFSDTDGGEISKVVFTNLIYPMLLTKDIYNSCFRKQKSGLIININSVAGKQPNEVEPVYCASKHGMRGFSESFKKEAIKNNVVVTDVYLGAMNTTMTSKKDQDKLMEVKEVAEVILNIASTYTSLRISELTILRKLY